MHMLCMFANQHICWCRGARQHLQINNLQICLCPKGMLNAIGLVCVQNQSEADASVDLPVTVETRLNAPPPNIWPSVSTKTPFSSCSASSAPHLGVTKCLHSHFKGNCPEAPSQQSTSNGIQQRPIGSLTKLSSWDSAICLPSTNESTPGIGSSHLWLSITTHHTWLIPQRLFELFTDRCKDCRFPLHSSSEVLAVISPQSSLLSSLSSAFHKPGTMDGHRTSEVHKQVGQIHPSWIKHYFPQAEPSSTTVHTPNLRAWFPLFSVPWPHRDGPLHEWSPSFPSSSLYACASSLSPLLADEMGCPLPLVSTDVWCTPPEIFLASSTLPTGPRCRQKSHVWVLSMQGQLLLRLWQPWRKGT